MGNDRREPGGDHPVWRIRWQLAVDQLTGLRRDKEREIRNAGTDVCDRRTRKPEDNAFKVFFVGGETGREGQTVM